MNVVRIALEKLRESGEDVPEPPICFACAACGEPLEYASLFQGRRATTWALRQTPTLPVLPFVHPFEQ